MRGPEMVLPSGARRVTQPLLRWFRRHRRDLPWRVEPRDPYHVWLSEVMLQQTQVSTVIPYYGRWLRRFPTLASLAAAPLDDVLKVWEGLGYYSRARNLHRAAQTVMSDHGGRVPSTVDALRKLPGIGRYTAGAIASLAFHQDAPVLDGNVIRVLTRLYGIRDHVNDSATLDRLWLLSESLIPHGHAGEFNEAMMDLGAVVCTPRQPACARCPLRLPCVAYRRGNPEAYPTKRRKAAVPVRQVVTTVILDANGRVLLAQRPPTGLLGGLWEFPGGESGSAKEPSADGRGAMADQANRIVRTRTGLRVLVRASSFTREVKHAFSHFVMVRHVAVVHLRRHAPATQGDGSYKALRWVTWDGARKLTLTRSDRRIADTVRDSIAGS